MNNPLMPIIALQLVLQAQLAALWSLVEPLLKRECQSDEKPFADYMALLDTMTEKILLDIGDQNPQLHDALKAEVAKMKILLKKGRES